MGNLSLYRVSIGLFAIGLLLVVSEAFGSGDKPGAIDFATRAIVNRLNAPPPAGDADAGAGHYELAVSQAYVEDEDETSAQADSDEATSEDAAQDDGSSAEPRLPPPPGVGEIHK